MKKTTVFGLLLAAMMYSCKERDADDEIPPCIRTLVNEFEASEMRCDDAHVRLYQFQGQKVYVFGPGSCGADRSAAVIDPNCNGLGTLGGITGNTKINGEDFSSAKLLREIWRNK